LNKQTQHSWPW